MYGQIIMLYTVLIQCCLSIYLNKTEASKKILQYYTIWLAESEEVEQRIQSAHYGTRASMDFRIWGGSWSPKLFHGQLYFLIKVCTLLFFWHNVIIIHYGLRYGCESWDYKEGGALKNRCFWTVVLEETCESLDCKDIQPVHPKGAQSCFVVHWKDWCWSWNSNTLATWCEDLTHLKRPWCWERLRAGEGDDRGWDGWMASPTQWTWVWVDSGSRWWTGRPGLLWSMGSQRVGHDWVTELNWMDYNTVLTHLLYGLGSQKICVACITAIFALL